MGRPRRASFQPDRYGDRWAPVLMHPEASAATAFRPGDLAGLATLGRGACTPSL